LATTQAEVVNSGNDKMVIARYRIRYFFSKKRGALTIDPGKSARYSSSLLPSSAAFVVDLGV